MCGIAGIVETHPNGVVDEAAVHRMCAAIVHRGPDDEGIYVKKGIGLGMRRLSIIDLAGGHQPVFNEDKTVWIVFNGEIYNFPELRAELEKRGHRFRTHTDTEVIVHLYEDLGSECVQKLRGMFAFALYDERRGGLLMARDRFGKKPLHYALSRNRLLFGSEIKSIHAIAPELTAINHEALLQYMYFGYIPDPSTAFLQIHKLPPGHLLEFEKGQVRVRQYWDLPQYGSHSPQSEEECLEELEGRLAEAVRIRLISDVPLGALLSGGTDSSTVVALMAQASSKPVKTFSIAFKHDDFNEARYARLVAQRFGTDHHELVIEPNILEAVEALSRSLEEPFGDSSMLPTYFVSCMARKHVTVALSGDGGDEIFAGYDRYAINLRRDLLGILPSAAGRFYRKNIFPWLPKNMRGRRLSYSVSLPWHERYVDSISFVPMFEREMPLLSGDFRKILSNGGNPEKVMYRLFDQAPAKDPVDKLLYVDTKGYLVGDILTKVDRMSMATSLEVRVPILDHVFVEWVTALPTKWKLRGKQQKYILRKLAERVGVPHEALYRNKQGFAMPLVHWIRHELKDLIMSALLEPRTLQRGYFEPTAIERLFDEHFSGRRDHSGGIWRLLMLELWHRNYLEKIQHVSAESCMSGATGNRT
ncbi:MAG TPA: asparagine synthase (glutamine-hydrolyzing) [Verrucomicrobiae bacterium]|jgi:asparagine synthase (glutamine-hydrolysing)|nr:asparagine synthase (glutamine-hydrolyzing) [Verrucomicrobiae bacterium]